MTGITKLKTWKRTAKDYAALAVTHRRSAEHEPNELRRQWFTELAHRMEVRARLCSAMDILRG